MSQTKLDSLSPERRRLLEVLDDGNSYSVTELCERANVNRNTYYEALKSDDFIAQLFHTSTGKIYVAIPDIVSKIVEQAKRGSFAHQKLLLEMMRLYQGVPQQQTNIQLNVTPIYGGQSVSERLGNQEDIRP